MQQLTNGVKESFISEHLLIHNSRNERFCRGEEGTEWDKKAGGCSNADAPLGSGLPSRERTDGKERGLVSRTAADNRANLAFLLIFWRRREA